MSAPIVIVGSGLAGYNAAKELRRIEPAAELAIVTADGGEFYSKPMLSNALASGKTPRSLPTASAEAMAAQLKALVRPRTRVTAIEPAARRVRIGSEPLPYSKLVLAVGAEQIRLPLEGDAADRVLTVNSLDDYARFRDALAEGATVLIVGAGLIGCEFANDLAATGHPVHVVDIAEHPLPRLLPPECGALLRAALEALGVRWHFRTSVRRVDAAGARLRVALGDGSAIETDLVLSAVGLRPKTELAREAGIAVSRGIAVNRLLETSAPDVYALGDCAEVEGLTLPFVMPILHAARALAPTLCGRPTPVRYPPMPVLVKTPACPTIVSPPPPGAAGQWRVERDGVSARALFVDGSGRLLGFALNGRATAERAKLVEQLPPVLA
jgi:rubredoxin-NAD+ reductase